MLTSAMTTPAATTSFRRINPKTGRLSGERYSLVLITKNDESKLKYWLLIRYDAYHQDWVVQLEIRYPDGHAITERTLSQRDNDLPQSVINRLGTLHYLMETAGAKTSTDSCRGKCPSPKSRHFRFCSSRRPGS